MYSSLFDAYSKIYDHWYNQIQDNKNNTYILDAS